MESLGRSPARAQPPASLSSSAPTASCTPWRPVLPLGRRPPEVLLGHCPFLGDQWEPGPAGRLARGPCAVGSSAWPRRPSQLTRRKRGRMCQGQKARKWTRAGLPPPVLRESRRARAVVLSRGNTAVPPVHRGPEPLVFAGRHPSSRPALLTERVAEKWATPGVQRGLAMVVAGPPGAAERETRRPGASGHRLRGSQGCGGQCAAPVHVALWTRSGVCFVTS